jgi:hypothetical protein
MIGRTLSQERFMREARRPVAQVYHWFTEGLETPDLTEAQTLAGKMIG